MRMVVCMKAVPSTTEVRMDPKTNTIVRDGRQSVVNPFDTAALEVALELKERLGGTVRALSMGIPDTARLLRDAIARGADSATLLSDRAFAGADTLATSYALSLALGEGGECPDLVLCGKMAVDGDTAQIGPELAGIMGVSCVAGVSEVVDAREGSLVVRRDTDEGAEVVEVPPPPAAPPPRPAVRPAPPPNATLRMPSIAGVRAGDAAEVEVLDAVAAGADRARCGLDGSPTQVVRSFVPERSNEAVELEGSVCEQAAGLLRVIEEVAR